MTLGRLARLRVWHREKESDKIEQGRNKEEVSGKDRGERGFLGKKESDKISKASTGRTFLWVLTGRKCPGRRGSAHGERLSKNIEQEWHTEKESYKKEF